MTEHTPTPWEVGHGPNKEVEIWGRMRMNASPILMSLGIMEHDPCEANAAFIVKAVNSHDMLVKALTDALCELTACAKQLKYRPEGSVDRAIGAARHILGVVSSPSNPGEK